VGGWGDYRQGKTEVLGRRPVPVRPQTMRQGRGLKPGLCREMVATNRWRHGAVTVMWENSRCLSAQSCETHIYTALAECKVL